MVPAYQLEVKPINFEVKPINFQVKPINFQVKPINHTVYPLSYLGLLVVHNLLTQYRITCHVQFFLPLISLIFADFLIQIRVN